MSANREYPRKAAITINKAGIKSLRFFYVTRPFHKSIIAASTGHQASAGADAAILFITINMHASLSTLAESLPATREMGRGRAICRLFGMFIM
ncbi:MAG TPA: hypothetical protein VJN01_09030, partial [Xanthomonadales bacterium]|nr:hypothetical protein [Xanthomonadales bacterium]